jgi:hypothetical protein
MSGGAPINVVPADLASLGAIAPGQTKSYSFLFQDENNNPLPAGTDIKGAVVGKGLSINAPSDFKVPCTTDPTGYSFSVTADPTQYGGGGNLTITTTSPAGLVTNLSYPFT